MTNNNGNLDRYLSLLVDSVKRIEAKLDKIADDHDERIGALEIHKAQGEGMQKTTSAIWGGLSGVASAVVAFVAQHYWGR